MLKNTLFLSDVALLGVSALAAFAFRHGTLVTTLDRPGLGLYLTFSLFSGFIVLLTTRTSHKFWRYFSLSDVFRIVAVTGLVILISWSMTFLVNRTELIPRSVPIIHWLFSIILLCSARIFARLVFTPRAFRKGQKSTHIHDHRHILLVGLTDIAELYIRCADRIGGGKISIAGILDENPSLKGRFLKSAEVIGNPKDVISIINRLSVHGIDVDEIVVTTAFCHLSESSRNALRDFEVRTNSSLCLFEDRLGFGVSDSANSSSNAFDSADILHFGRKLSIYSVVKRAIDFFGALTLLVSLSPLIILSIMAVLIDVGAPVYFWQFRPGWGGKPFRILKFRTMRGAHDIDGNRIPDSDRSSTIGETLRLFRIDELPQLLNILRGDMSFVGPRPLLPIDQPEFLTSRLSVRPGLTGWAQVNGGRGISKEDKAALDVWYVENVSLLLDIEILFRTIMVLIRGEKMPRYDTLKAARDSLHIYRRSIEKSGTLHQAN